MPTKHTSRKRLPYSTEEKIQIVQEAHSKGWGPSEVAARYNIPASAFSMWKSRLPWETTPPVKEAPPIKVDEPAPGDETTRLRVENQRLRDAIVKLTLERG